MLRNMGQICGMLLKSMYNEEKAYEDIAAFGAPSECMKNVAQGFELDRCSILESAEASTGYTVNELLDELEQRVPVKWLAKSGIYKGFDELLARREQAEIDRRMKKYRNQSRLPGARRLYY